VDGGAAETLSIPAFEAFAAKIIGGAHA